MAGSIFEREYWVIVAERPGDHPMHLNIEHADDSLYWTEEAVFDPFFNEEYAHIAAKEAGVALPLGYKVSVVKFRISPCAPLVN